MAKRKVSEDKEAKEKAKRKAKEAKEKEKIKAQKAKEREKRKAEEAKEATKKAKKVKPAKEKAKKAEPPKEKLKKAAVAEGLEPFRGMVTLNIMPPIDLKQLDSFKEALLKFEDLRVVVMSGAVAEGSRILVSVEEPLPLLDILRAIPAVGEVVPKGDNIEVSLKTS